MAKLSDQDLHFCKEYLIHLDPFQAARDAFTNLKGGDPALKKKAKVMMGRAAIINKIKELKSERSTRLNLSVDGVILKITEVIDRCMQSAPVLDRQGNFTGEYRFDAANALKGLELLGKHFGIWLERYAVSDPVSEVLAKKLDAVPLDDLQKFLGKNTEVKNGKLPSVIDISRN